MAEIIGNVPPAIDPSTQQQQPSQTASSVILQNAPSVSTQNAPMPITQPGIADNHSTDIDSQSTDLV